MFPEPWSWAAAQWLQRVSWLLPFEAGLPQGPYWLNCRVFSSRFLPSTSLALTWESYTASAIIPRMLRAVPRCSARVRRRYTQIPSGALMTQPTHWKEAWLP